jgi:excinuclease UvrABC ATPase subunit
MQVLESLAKAYGFSLETPWQDLPGEVRLVILHGTGGKPVAADLQGRAQGIYVNKAFEGVHLTNQQNEIARRSSRKSTSGWASSTMSASII